MQRRLSVTRTDQITPDDQEWNAMIAGHERVQRQLNERGQWLPLIIEGLRFDADILRHALRRWMIRTDARCFERMQSR